MGQQASVYKMAEKESPAPASETEKVPWRPMRNDADTKVSRRLEVPTYIVERSHKKGRRSS
jgi:hypothetical protein